jgi:hypothetical protein
MNFLALPLLFPILTIAAFLLCPIKTVKLTYGCLTGFFKDIVAHMSIGERLRSFVCVFAMASEMNIKRRVRQIGNAVKVAASLLVVAALLGGIVVPGLALGTVWGVLKFVFGSIFELVQATGESVDEVIGEALDAAVRPARNAVA